MCGQHQIRNHRPLIAAVDCPRKPTIPVARWNPCPDMCRDGLLCQQSADEIGFELSLRWLLQTEQPGRGQSVPPPLRALC